MFKLKGVIPPVITPFTESGELDEKGLQQLVEYLNGKVHGLFICGSYVILLSNVLAAQMINGREKYT